MKLEGYEITSNLLTLRLITEDGEVVEVPMSDADALLLGDDIFHVMYTGKDDEDQDVHSITRTFAEYKG